MTLTPDQLKAFCEAWQIPPTTQEWELSSSVKRFRFEGSKTNIEAFLSALDNDASITYKPTGRLLEYPTLTLELLLGVCKSANADVRLDWINSEDENYTMIWIWLGTREVSTNDRDHLAALIKAMAKFKGVEL